MYGFWGKFFNEKFESLNGSSLREIIPISLSFIPKYFILYVDFKIYSQWLYRSGNE